MALPVPTPPLGVHLGTKGGLAGAVREADRIGATALQVFTSSPQIWRAKPVDPDSAIAFREARVSWGGHPVVVHDSYLINLAASTEELREKSYVAFADELDRCATYGVELVNSHMGAHVGQGEPEGVRLVGLALRRLLANSDPSMVILLETTAGSGTSLGATFESLAAMMVAAGDSPRLAICLDSCHVFAAGNDVRTAEGVAALLDRFDAVIGLSRLRAVHLNDAKAAFGSRKDRHANIGSGEIGFAGLAAFLNEPRLVAVPMILETPQEGDAHLDDLARLKSRGTGGAADGS